MPHIYIAPYEWHTHQPDPEGPARSYWRCPGGNATSSLDIRTIPQMAVAGGSPQGFGVFCYDTPQVIPDALEIGSDFDGRINGALKNNISIKLGLPVASTQVNNLLAELLTDHVDPAGITGRKPLRGLPNAGVQLVQRGQVLWSRSFDTPDVTNIVNVFREDYRRRRSGLSAEALRGFTGFYLVKYLEDFSDAGAQRLLPPEYVDDGYERPHTTYTDDFNRTENPVESYYRGDNGFQANGTAAVPLAFALCEIYKESSDLDGDDHYCQVLCGFERFNSTQGTIVRVADSQPAEGSAFENYYGGESENGSTDYHRTFRNVSGTETQIGYLEESVDGSAKTIYTKVDGSTLSYEVDSTEKLSDTDTNITGNVKFGIRGGHPTQTFDDLEAADLGGAPAATPRLTLLGVG